MSDEVDLPIITKVEEPIRLPDFVVPGVMKSGTTSLHFYLSQHSDVWMPQGKLQETHFFDYDENYLQGIEWYGRRLSGRTSEAMVGQTCPNYFHLPKVPARMSALMPKVKLIFILRNPVDRAYSHYWHSKKKGRENLSFGSGLRKEARRILKSSRDLQNFSYVLRGKYVQHLKEWLKYYKLEDMHIVKYEDMKLEPCNVVNACFDFLCLPRLENLDVEIHNKTEIPKSYLFKRVATSPKLRRFPLIDRVAQFEQKHNRVLRYPSMKDSTRSKLIDFYKPFNKELSNLTGIDFSSWNQ